jgi:hypothetical protein
MTSTPGRPDNHDPTPEFQAALRQTVTDAFRREAEFAFAPRTGARIRFYVGLGVAASVILAVGILVGASTGLAAAAVIDAGQREVIASNVSATRQFAAMRLDLARTKLEDVTRAAATHTATPAELAAADSDFREMSALVARIDLDEVVVRRMPEKRAWSAIACGVAAIAGNSKALPVRPESALNQQGIRTVDMPNATTKSAETIGALMGLNEVTGGGVLINDSRRRQVRLFDSTLATSVVTLDSVAASGAGSYGARWAPLMRFRGDSSLIVEMPARSLRILDGRGQVARTLAPPSLPAHLSARSYVDDRGRLLYTPFPGYGASADSTPIIRLDLLTRSADTVARVRLGYGFAGRTGRDSGGANSYALWIGRGVRNSTTDDWALLSNGAIAVLRGREYRIDLIRPDGTTLSASVPIDSSRMDRDSMPANFGRLVVTDSNTVEPAKRLQRATVVLKRARADVQFMTLTAENLLGETSPRPGTVIPDMDGNLWILPSYATALLSEPLVYDVVNSSGVLVERVRVPTGQWIAGFGRDRAVYLVSGTRRLGYILERTRFRVGGK